MGEPERSSTTVTIRVRPHPDRKSANAKPRNIRTMYRGAISAVVMACLLSSVAVVYLCHDGDVKREGPVRFLVRKSGSAEMARVEVRGGARRLLLPPLLGHHLRKKGPWSETVAVFAV